MTQEQFSNESGIKEKYLSKTDKDGYLPLAETRMEFNRQIKSIAAFLDGDEGTEPDINYGNGIRHKGSSGNYSDMKIHIDDLEVFIERVKKHYGEQ